jgi:uncharacterized protein YkwD
MPDLFSVRFFKIIFLTAITIIWARWDNSQLVGQAVTAKNSLSTSTYLLTDSSSKEQMATLEQLTFERVNQYRAKLDLAPLELNPLISEQARNHSKNMAHSNVPLGHEGFKSRLAALKKAIAYRSAAENVAYNSGYDDPVSEAVAGWIDSPSHRQNMVGNYNVTGVGVAKNHQGEYYLTQIFILEP